MIKAVFVQVRQALCVLELDLESANVHRTKSVRQALQNYSLIELGPLWTID